jgi:hypothetical protein
VHEHEGERGAERVDRRQQLEVGRRDEGEREQRAEPDQDDGRVVAGVQPADERRDLTGSGG